MFLDLGNAAEIDQAAIASLESLRPGRNDAGSSLAQLSKVLVGPLLPHLLGSRHIVISPDGELNRLPFGLLFLPDGQHLCDVYHVSYVATGRDMLHWQAPPMNTTAAVVIADPDFDLADKPPPHDTTSDGPPPIRGWPEPFRRLRGARREGLLVQKALGADTALLTEKRALVPQLKACRSPRVLHVATHGFFLPARLPESSGETDDHQESRDRLQELVILGSDNALLRAGLALAGAQTWRRGGRPPKKADGGIVTALDLAALDGGNRTRMSICLRDWSR